MSAHVHGKRSPFTDVTETGITFTVCDCGILLGGVAPLGKRLVSNLLTGKIRVTTPHRAGGAYRERGAGGVYATINPKAPLFSRSLLISWYDLRFLTKTNTNLSFTSI